MYLQFAEGNSLKQRLLVFAAAAILMMATPDFGRPEEPLLRGFYFNFEGRYAFSDGDKYPYAETGSAGDIFVDDRVLEIDLDSDFGGRFGAGFMFGNSFDMEIHYSGLRTTHKKPISPFNSYAYFFPLILPLPPPTSSSLYNGNVLLYGTERAAAELTYDVIDFDAGYTFKLGSSEVRLFGGIRYAKFQQMIEFHSVGRRGGQSGVKFLSLREIEGWGVGPRVGAMVSLPISRGFHLTGSVSGSALFGDRDTADSMIHGQIFRFTSSTQVPDDNNSFYNAEGELGVAYGVEMSNASSIMVTLGYRAEVWFDVSNTANSAKSGRSGVLTGRTFGSEDADQIFHGPFLRGELRF